MDSSSATSSAMAVTLSSDASNGLQQFKQNLSNLLPLKLDHTNYVLWKIQMEVALQGHNLYDHILGTTPPPSPQITNTSGVTLANPAYTAWFQMDQQLKSCMYASITAPVLAQVIHLPTTTSIWKALANKFSSLSRSHIHQLKEDLQTTSKGSQSMQVYLDKIKGLSDQLLAAAEVISDEDLVLLSEAFLTPMTHSKPPHCSL